MVLYSKFIAKAMPNKMHMGNNPKTMYMLCFITYYRGKTLNCYTKYYICIYENKTEYKTKDPFFQEKPVFQEKRIEKKPTQEKMSAARQ